MMNLPKVATWFVVALCFVSVPAAAIAPGAMAPDFTLKSTTGKNLRLAEQRGRVLLINFWATWCAPCREELPLLDALDAKYRGAGFAVLAVNLDEDPTQATGMAKKLGIRMPILFDRDKQTSKRFDVDAMPTTVLVDRSGKIRFLHRGYRPGYEKTYEQQVRELLR